MAVHIDEAAAKGELEIGDSRSPVTYTLTTRQDDKGAFRVDVSLSAPRDWLLKQGFRHDATLLRSTGAAIPVRFEDTLDVTDNISVPLTAFETIGSVDELHEKYPEIRLN